jgi:hypothetical protein
VTCQEWIAEIVECARGCGGVSPQLAAHVRQCAACAERFEAEQFLTGQLRLLRDAAAGERSSPFRRARLFEEFDRLRPAQPRRRFHRFMPAAAAAAVAALAVGLSWTPVPDLPAQTADAREARSVANEEFQEISDDSGFVAVPYAPPLATGEFVRVVRTELYAAALDRMGVSVPVTNGEFRADVVVGQDGLPRAVRLLGTEEVSN